jgi:predicted nucleic acid-binding protein
MARRSKPKAYVLDTWAIMAYMGDEPAGPTVEALILDAHESVVPLLMSVANVAEVWYTFAREMTAAEADQALIELRQLGIEFLDVTLAQALQAAKFKAKHKMSLADCFAAALAVEHKAELVTGDAEFKEVDSSVRIVWLPSQRPANPDD